MKGFNATSQSSNTTNKIEFSPPHWILWTILILEGFVTISLEILTIRQLIPFVGNSVVVTSLIIGVFLLFLAYGYRKGGSYLHDTLKLGAILKRNFFYAALLLGIGLSYAFLELFFVYSLKLMTLPPLILLTFYLLIITAPMVYLLGQTVPIVMNLIKEQNEMLSFVGKTGGKVLHLSTIGSFLGSVLTALILMNTVGVAATIFINFTLLSLLMFLLFFFFGLEYIKLIILVCAFLFIFKLNVEFEHLAFFYTNSYNNYSVTPIKNLYGTDGNVLVLNRQPSSYLNKDKQGFPYIEKIKEILFKDLTFTNKDILVLGAGGFTLSSENTYGNRFTYVDIDPNLQEKVRQHFNPQIQGDFIAMDARVFLKQHTQSYDAIVSDVFTNRLEIPPHLSTREYFLAVNSALKADGIAIFNIIGLANLKPKFERSIDSTLHSVFHHCMVIPLSFKNIPTNILYVCPKTKLDEKQIVYTDDINTASLDVGL